MPVKKAVIEPACANAVQPLPKVPWHAFLARSDPAGRAAHSFVRPPPGPSHFPLPTTLHASERMSIPQMTKSWKLPRSHDRIHVSAGGTMPARKETSP